MISCEECIERMYPDNPRVKSGRYHLSGCDYCNKPYSLRKIEMPEPEIPDSIEIRQLRHQVIQARAGFLYLQKKLNEHLDKGKNKDKI